LHQQGAFAPLYMRKRIPPDNGTANEAGGSVPPNGTHGPEEA
jgi:hypothetical protein